MLELQDISLTVGKGARERNLLRGIDARLPQGHLCAVLGPSGCGKSTLVKVVAGLIEPTSGAVRWEGRNLAEGEDLAPHEIGYVPQFSIAFDHLTVEESVQAAIRLRIGGLNDEEVKGHASLLLADTGIADIADRQVKVLSGGQKRRLALALELVCAPALLLCDEVTSGLDPKAEDEIVKLLKELSRQRQRIVINVTHSLRHLDLYDSVLLLYEGHLVYHGPPQFLFYYFSVDNPQDLFPRLTTRTANGWHESWLKHRASYEQAQAGDAVPPAAAAESVAGLTYEQLKERLARSLPKPALRPHAPVVETAAKVAHTAPSTREQFRVLLARRWRIFFRDRMQLLLHLALMFGFPCLVVIFAWGGLPQIQNLTLEGRPNLLEQAAEKAAFIEQAMRVGGLVSGLVMFQVILLTLMGANNAAREIAGERLVFEKEKFAGLSPLAYVASKAAFLGVLVLLQSVWMGVFVNMICGLPGNLLLQIVLLVLVNAAMTALCLGISSLMRSPEQASLVSVYFVGFQLPLSGAVLALPETVASITRPFIAAYWGWSGFLQTLRDTRFYDLVVTVTQTGLSALLLCFWVLLCHVFIGLFLAHTGARSSRWE